jgi:excisionase family DNA binding protein
VSKPSNSGGRRNAIGGADMPPVAYTVNEAAALARVGRTTLYAEIKAGRLPVRKVRNRTLILAEEFAAWLRALPPTARAA